MAPPGGQELLTHAVVFTLREKRKAGSGVQQELVSTSFIDTQVIRDNKNIDPMNVNVTFQRNRKQRKKS